MILSGMLTLVRDDWHRLFSAICPVLTDNLGRRIDDKELPVRIGLYAGEVMFGRNIVRSRRRLRDTDDRTRSAGADRRS